MNSLGSLVLLIAVGAATLWKVLNHTEDASPTPSDSLRGAHQDSDAAAQVEMARQQMMSLGKHGQPSAGVFAEHPRRASVADVESLIAQYSMLHKRAMDPKDTQPKRFYVATVFAWNTGNRALVLMTHLLLAMMSGRALVFDGWLQGFDFPLELQVKRMPQGFMKKVRRRLGVGAEPINHWMPAEQAMCTHVLREALRGEEIYFYPNEFKAPHMVGLVANSRYNAWFSSHIGDHFRLLTKWFFRPSARVLWQAEQVEKQLCNGRRCDVGIHIRRGHPPHPHPDFYFPEDGTGNSLALRLPVYAMHITHPNVEQMEPYPSP